MGLVIVSDTHGRHDLIDSLPEGDVLIQAGDFMNSGLYPEEIRSFNCWLGEQPIKHRVVCGGNHDRLFQIAPPEARALLTNAAYLENTGVTIEGVSFWGSPYTPEFLNWAFMYPRGRASQYWDQFPANWTCSSLTVRLMGFSTRSLKMERISAAKNCSWL
jgi:hypothetical protein